MRQVGILFAAVVLAGTVGACSDPYADPYYGYRTRQHAYSSDRYYPNQPVYYSNGPYYYSSGPYHPSPYYRSRYDYYRNYNGIHSNTDVTAL